MAIPLQSQMDMDNPREHLLWALVSMGGKIGAPLLLPRPMMEDLSAHLYACGFRHDPTAQQRWYHPPASDALWEQSSGRWEDRPPQGDEIDEVLTALSPAAREELRRRLTPDPATPEGENS